MALPNIIYCNIIVRLNENVKSLFQSKLSIAIICHSIPILKHNGKYNRFWKK